MATTTRSAGRLLYGPSSSELNCDQPVMRPGARLVIPSIAMTADHTKNSSRPAQVRPRTTRRAPGFPKASKLRPRASLNNSTKSRAANSRTEPSTKLHEHMNRSLSLLRRKLQKRLKRCQRAFSEETVHELRVTIRRLQALLGLLSSLVPGKSLRRAYRGLRAKLGMFGTLRDTQVQMRYISQVQQDYHEAHSFYLWLSRQERDQAHLLKKKVRNAKTRKLFKSTTAVQAHLRRLEKSSPQDHYYAAALKTADRAFAKVVALRRRIDGTDTSTIHDTRVAFKKFRYLIECLEPILAGVTSRQKAAMHKYQMIMGDVQDMDVLLSTLETFIRKKKPEIRSMQRLVNGLTQRRCALIENYLKVADQLFSFWPTHRHPARRVVRNISG